MKNTITSTLLILSLSLAAQSAGAVELLKLDFENGSLGNASILSDGAAIPRAVSATEVPAAAGSVEGSQYAMRLAEDPEMGSTAGYKPAVDFDVILPADIRSFTIEFDFKQMSGDASGLSVDILQKNPSYGAWARLYLGKQLTNSMVSGPVANSSVLIKQPALSNGPESVWHRIKFELRVSDAGAFTILTIDGVEKSGLPAYMHANPSAIQGIRFSNDGAGPDLYFIDNLTVSYTTASDSDAE